MSVDQVIGYCITAIVGGTVAALAASVLVAIWRGKIDLTYLLSEPPSVSGDPPKASLSRFQALVFTFVIAGLYLVLCLRRGEPVELGESPIVLLGITSATYLGGKAITASKDQTDAAQQEKTGSSVG
jgi:hypothetical protein